MLSLVNCFSRYGVFLKSPLFYYVNDSNEMNIIQLYLFLIIIIFFYFATFFALALNVHELKNSRGVKRTTYQEFFKF